VRFLFASIAAVLVGCGARTDLGGKTTSSGAPPPPPTVAKTHQLALGFAHSCAIRSGRVYCWGVDHQGELGDGTTTSSLAPVAVAGITNAVSIAATDVDDDSGDTRGSHTCALLADGRVRCWGQNVEGSDDALVAHDTIAPTDMGVDHGVAVAVAELQTCVARDDGSIVCWGFDQRGALGDGSTASVVKGPVAVTDLADAFDVGASPANAGCAIRANGSVWCWGDGAAGALGDGVDAQSAGSVDAASSAVPIASLVTDATEISRTCAVLASGTIACWGPNDFGQTGNGTISADIATPTLVGGITTAAHVAVGRFHACALVADGAVLCWGRNDEGQLGVVPSGDIWPNPVVARKGDAVEVAVGGYHTCARLDDDSVWCWGSDGDGELGDGAPAYSKPTPVRVVGLP